MLDAKYKSSYTGSVNKLPLETRTQILSMLCEGSSMRAISRITGTSINTVTKLLVDAGTACEAFHDSAVHGLKTANLQCDEIWSFCGAKQANVKKMKTVRPDMGDAWTFTALDRDSKMIVSWFAGDRSSASAQRFLADTAARIDTPVQVSTDGFGAYQSAVNATFPLDTTYGQVQKSYRATADKGPERKYSPGVCVCSSREPIFGEPEWKNISTSHVERMNLNMRMGMRRFTRLTNAFSKKLDNHLNALALYFVFYNWVRVHKSLDGRTPAMAAGLAKKPMTVADIVGLIDEAECEKHLEHFIFSRKR